MTNSMTISSLLRLVGLMAMAVGAAWVLQVLGLGGSSAIGQLMWVVSAAAVAGAGAGLVFTSAALHREDDSSARA